MQFYGNADIKYYKFLLLIFPERHVCTYSVCAQLHDGCQKATFKSIVRNQVRPFPVIANFSPAKHSKQFKSIEDRSTRARGVPSYKNRNHGKVSFHKHWIGVEKTSTGTTTKKFSVLEWP